jgi:hypothetical protein
MEQRSDASPKCSQCSVPILDSDLILRDHGQLYHVQCVRILTSDERVREFRELRRAREANITPNGKHLARASGLRAEPPAVLCEICRTGIGSIAELAMTDSGPTHVRCRPTDLALTHDGEPPLLDGTYK